MITTWYFCGDFLFFYLYIIYILDYSYFADGGVGKSRVLRALVAHFCAE